MSLISLNQLNMALNAMKQKMKSFRGNWEQNDPTADDYIRNRPFYSEKKMNVIVAKQDVDGFQVMQDPVYCATVSWNFEPTIDNVYEVNWDGESYTVNLEVEEAYGMHYMGNKNYVGMMPGGDIPFALIFSYGTIYIATESTKSSHTISISTKQNVVHQIDKKYVPIPDGVVTEEGLNNRLSTVAFTGSYYHLSDSPVLSTVATSGNYSDLLNKPPLSTVATSGNYNDLIDAPSTDSYLSETSTNAVQNSVVTNALDNKLGFKTISLPKDTMDVRQRTMCYGNGKFVAIFAYNKCFIYSYDGINWFNAKELSSQLWNAICYGNGKFVVVTNKGGICYSTDGIDWTWCSGGSVGSHIDGVCFCGDKFFSFSTTSGGRAVYYSVDGITWTETNLKDRTKINNICFGDGKYVFVGDDHYAYSSDGISWTVVDVPESLLSCRSLCYGDGKFVMCLGTGGICHSIDGITWSQVILNGKSFNDMYYVNERFIARASLFNDNGSISNDTIAYSTDGINWTYEKYPDSMSGFCICCYGNGKFIGSYSGGSHYNHSIAYSTDGIYWVDKILYQSGEDKTKEIAEHIAPYLTNDSDSSSVDSTLTIEGSAADAKAVGDALATKQPVGDYVLKDEISEYVDEAIADAEFAQVQSDWSSLDVNSDSFIQNKPFGYRPDVVPLDTYSFVKIDGTNTYAYMKGNNTNIFDFEGEGVEYVVEWGGLTYTCTSKTTSGTLNGSAPISSTITGVGDASKFVFGGLPFIPSDPVDEYPFFISSSGIFTFSSSESRVVRVYLKDNIVKIDSKFLPDIGSGAQVQADWEQTDESAADFIKNKPSPYRHPDTHSVGMITGLMPAAINGTYSSLRDKPFCELKPVLEETTRSFSPVYSADLEICAEEFSRFDLVKGETYRVMWDGNEYLCECKDIADALTGLSVDTGMACCSLYLGSLNMHPFVSLLIPNLEDTNEPFLITVAGLYDYSNESAIFIKGTELSSHTISITPVNTIKKLDEKYLPDTAATKQWVQEFAEEALAGLDISGGSGGTAVTETEILPEMELSFISVPETPLYLWQTYGDTDTYPNPKLCELVEGKTYNVVWDGTEYPCVANIAEIPNDHYPVVVIGIGNWSLGGAGEDTGEPFAFGVFQDGSNTAIYTTDSGDTHTVRIYQKADLTVSWDNVTDKPFYEETYSVTANSTTVKEDVTFEGLGFSWVKVTDETLPKGTVVGATITATSAGATLNLEVTQDSVIVDNDNGIGCLLVGQVPFLMIYIPGEITVSALGITETVNIPETGTYMVDVIPEGEGFTIESKSVKKIDDKFQHQTDWNETDESSAAYIKNRPFGDAIPSGTVLIDRTVTYDSEDFGLVLVDMDTGESYIKTELVIDGATYIVDINGHIYRGEYVDENTILSMMDASDVTCSGGLLLYDTAENLVGLLCIKFFDAISFIWDLNGAFGLTHMESYPVKIAVWDATKKIDQKYLPYGVDYTPREKITSFEATNLSTVDDGTSAAAALSTIGLNAFMYFCPSDSQWTENKCTIGETYALNIGNEIIYAEAKSEEGDWELYFGNLSIFGEVAVLEGSASTNTIPDTGEDYLIFSNDTDGVPNGGFQILSRTNYGDSVSIAIYSVTEKVTPIEPKYIPSPPEFDLTAMGLPTIPLDGTYVSVTCDTAELCNAAERGMIKCSINVGDFELQPFTTLTYVPAANQYSSISMAVFSNVPYVIEVNVYTDRILGRAIALGGGSSSGCLLPEVTTDDNGKFAQVVDGAWSAVEVQDVSEVGL